VKKKYNSLTCKITLATTICLTTVSICADTTQGKKNIDQYLDLSLQDLLSVEVTSVSKTHQSLSDVATAVYVITDDDIKRSGSSTIPELLRLAPGINVAQIDAYQWAISARGFNGLRANKLLVMLDGRSLYTPLYGGVYWDAQDVLLEDVARIEVIRGPGGSIWGANAVNGVINIITHNTKDTQGNMISAGAGNETKAVISARHGGSNSQKTHYKLYAKARKHDDSINYNDLPTDDAIRFLQSGFRVDHQTTKNSNINLQGDIYRGLRDMYSEINIPTAPFQLIHRNEVTSGGNLMARWEDLLENNSQVSLQVHIDQNKRESTMLHDSSTTIDTEFQLQLAPKGQHSITWGASYRYFKDEFNGDFTLTTDNERREDDLFGAYVQDEISFATHNIKLILGSKVEHNDYSGIEIQPSVRMLWSPDESQSYWAAISRAVHTPTRFSHDGEVNIYIPSQFAPMIISVQGNRELDSESLIAYEAGWRSQINKALSLDLALFYNDYDKLRGRTSGDVYFENGIMVIPTMYDNNLTGNSHGFEVSAVWQAADWWQIQSNYSYLRLKVDSEVNSSSDEAIADISPEHQVNIISNFSISPKINLNLSARYVSKLTGVPAYLELDTNLAWRIKQNLALSLIGRNLLDKQHPELLTAQSSEPPNEQQRAIFTKIRWDF